MSDVGNREDQKSCSDFLDEKIRGICGLPSDTPITEDFLRKELDKTDMNATSMDPGYQRKHPGMKLLTHKEAVERLKKVRTAKF